MLSLQLSLQVHLRTMRVRPGHAAVSVTQEDAVHTPCAQI